MSQAGLLAAAAFLCERARAHWLAEDKYVDDITVLAVRFTPGRGATAAQPTATAASSTATTAASAATTTTTSTAAAAAAAITASQASAAPAGRSDLMQAQRGSATGRGATGKRGAVSGESSSAAGRGSAQLGRVTKSATTVQLLMGAIRAPRHLIFHGMTEAAQRLVCACMFEQQARAEQVVIRQGECGDIVYVVESGRYEVYLCNPMSPRLQPCVPRLQPRASSLQPYVDQAATLRV